MVAPMAEAVLPTLSEQLASFAIRTLSDGAPADVRASVQQRVLDVTGLQLAARPLATSSGALAYALAQGGPDQAYVVGESQRISAPWAAFANGVLAHSLDYDDTHLPSVLHPSASVVPAALAAAEQSGADGARVLDAIAVGIEVVVRLGMVGYDRELRNSVFFEHGQHATSICGTIGSAIAASLLLDGSERGVVDAIGVSASMAGGIIEANRTGGTVKRLHCGWAAHAGVTAAQLVTHGFTGPPTALEGRFGFFEAYLQGRVALHEVTDRLGEHWEVPGIFFKPYPANHFTHTALDAARIVRERGVAPDDVEAVVLGVAGATVRTIGEPIDVKQAPESGYQAQFSGPYMVALGFLGGGGLGAGLDDFTDALATDPDRRALMARVSVVADEACDAVFPYQFPATLKVRTRGGDEHKVAVMANRGGNEQPLSDAELATKFRDNAARSLGAEASAAVEDAVAALPGAPSVAPLLEACVGA
jgi:2-methylcitrate dehydratase PrpD